MNKIEQAFEESAKFLISQTMFYAKAKPFWDPIIDALAALNEKLEVGNTYVGMSYESMAVTASGNKELLVNVMRIMRQAGYDTETRPEEKQTTYSAVWKREGAPNVGVTFYSTVCRKVQVGTETKEVPIFEVQCGDA